MAPHPKDVFDNPATHWSFLTASNDRDCEGQHFDRKEAGRPKANGSIDLQRLLDDITECVSAFANSNRDGGLLVLGIEKTGQVPGIKHLSDSQRNAVTNIGPLLRHQSAQVRSHDCLDARGDTKEIILIYAPYTTSGICETPSSFPKAWARNGAQNVPLDQAHREQLLRDKCLSNFERAIATPFHDADLDPVVVAEYRKASGNTGAHLSDQEFLYQIGALQRDNGGFAFTNAGLLFFATNPQRVLPTAYVRLLKYELLYKDAKSSMLPTVQREFTGSLTKQIRDLRSFFEGSGFFKVYQKRLAAGGFVDDPEYPYVAVDEAIVNAVAHRDYAMNYPIECRYYKDAFIVSNAGRILQREGDVPNHFTLDTTQLVSMPRNGHLMEWLRRMRDAKGAAFVQALSEGTKKMEAEMRAANLPPPEYATDEATTVILRSNAPAREALLRASAKTQTTEYANLFPLTITTTNNPAWVDVRKEIREALKSSLQAQGWFLDHDHHGRVTAHRRGAELPLPQNAAEILKLFPAYSLQLYEFYGQPFLCIDYTVEVKNTLRLTRLLQSHIAVNDLVGRRSLVQWRGWQQGKILSIDAEHTKVYLYEFREEIELPNTDVIPELPTILLDVLLAQRAPGFDLHRTIKQASLSATPKAARERSEKTLQTAQDLATTVFPLRLSTGTVQLEPTPVSLNHEEATTGTLPVYVLPEPPVEFHQHTTPDVREGITKFGSYDTNAKVVEIVPVCLVSARDQMAALIERLKVGKYLYRGAERTFKTRFTYASIIPVPAAEAIKQECERLLNEHPDWQGDKTLSRIFLVQAPEAGYSIDDEQSPYYRVKRLLLERGIPCQMVDTPTLRNPDYKDLNLALNLVAKCGVTPWVLPGRMPDADFFIGLSYTQNARRGQERYMGYANVFDQFGRWEFYSGSAETFQYDDRTIHFHDHVVRTLQRIKLSETPSVYFHYSAKFSRDDRDAILRAARSVRPKGTYTFVWINMHHSVRLYDARPETDGSLSRGHFIVTSPHQLYLSTTGANPYRRTLGTPHMLEVNAWRYGPSAITPPMDARAQAAQLLSLTKLNWASTDSLCAEPITTKYAGDIAYLAAAFLRQDATFSLHPVLETTPWFI